MRDRNEMRWEIKEVLYANGKVLVVETREREHLQHIVSEFERVCDSMGLERLNC